MRCFQGPMAVDVYSTFLQPMNHSLLTLCWGHLHSNLRKVKYLYIVVRNTEVHSIYTLEGGQTHA